MGGGRRGSLDNVEGWIFSALAVLVAVQAAAIVVCLSRLQKLTSRLEAHEQASAGRHAAGLSYASRAEEERAAPLQ